MADRMLERAVSQDARQLRRILKAVALGQSPDDLDPEDLALVALHRDGLLAALDEESRRVLESLVDELVSLGIGPGEAPERLDESTLAASAGFADAVAEYVGLLRTAVDDPDDEREASAGITGELPRAAVIDAAPRGTAAAQLLCAAVLLSLLTPGAEAEERTGWISANRRRHLRSLLVAQARARTLPPPAATLDSSTAAPRPGR